MAKTYYFARPHHFSLSNYILFLLNDSNLLKLSCLSRFTNIYKLLKNVQLLFENPLLLIVGEGKRWETILTSKNDCIHN